MKLNLIDIEATTLSDAWFQTVYNCLEHGRDFKIDRGSYEGDQRLEFDYITVHITHPGSEPILPSLPSQYSIPNPVAEDYLTDYIPYLMTGELKKGEAYTYGQRLTRYPFRLTVGQLTDYKLYTLGRLIENNDFKFSEVREMPFIEMENDIAYINQLELAIWMYKNKGYRNNQMVLQIAHPTDMLLNDPPCLRSIDTRIQDGKLHFVVYFRSWDLWCIDEKTEALTKRGWQTIDTINEDDVIASYNDTTHEIEFTDILDINKQDYEGKMFKIETKRIDQLVTPNHKIFHKYITHSGNKRSVEEKYNLTRIDELKIKHGSFIPISAPCNDGKWSIGKTKASLIGWVLTDSYYRKGCKTIEIYQTSKKYTNEIRGILVELNINYNERVVERPYKDTVSTLHTFTIPANEAGWIRDIIPNREPTHDLISLCKEDRKALFESMIMADGTYKLGRNNTLSWTFYSQKLYRLEWFQLLAFSLGYSTLINEKKGVIQISSKRESMLQPIHFSDNGKLPTKYYNGKVWCVNTKHGNFVIRRNNKISITGNSGFPANLAAIQQLKEYLAGEIGVEDGEMIASSKGLHLYSYCFELAEIIRGKTIEEFRNGK